MRQIAHLFKALSDPIRLRIVLMLESQGELCVCDLMAVLGLPQSTVSRHLAYLKRTGWLDGRRQGVWMYYRISESCTPLNADILRSLRQHASDSAEAVSDRLSLTALLKDKPAACS